MEGKISQPAPAPENQESRDEEIANKIGWGIGLFAVAFGTAALLIPSGSEKITHAMGAMMEVFGVITLLVSWIQAMNRKQEAEAKANPPGEVHLESAWAEDGKGYYTARIIRK